MTEAVPVTEIRLKSIVCIFMVWYDLHSQGTPPRGELMAGCSPVVTDTSLVIDLAASGAMPASLLPAQGYHVLSYIVQVDRVVCYCESAMAA